jgi:hypothetical protein
MTQLVRAAWVMCCKATFPEASMSWKRTRLYCRTTPVKYSGLVRGTRFPKPSVKTVAYEACAQEE